MDFDALPKYFLGANACGGFVSEFEKCYNPADNWRAYIIKGGPGTGKSTLMKKVVKKATEKGIECILCPCSSDTDSLDGVILPDKKTVILDGTSPHTVEPKFPALCEEIINTGAFWNSDKLKDKNELFSLFKLNKAHHARASQYITAAGQLLKYNFTAELNAADLDKIFKFCAGPVKALIPLKGAKGKEWVRFLAGTTPKGFIFYRDTVDKLFGKKVIISSPYSAVGTVILSCIRDYAIDAGYEVITVKNPILPDDIIDHILIPELNLAFVTENDFYSFGDDTRRIHSRRFTDTAYLRQIKKRLNFNRKMINQLLDCASAQLREAKAVHDKIERHYTDIMDFEALNLFTDGITDKII